MFSIDEVYLSGLKGQEKVRFKWGKKTPISIHQQNASNIVLIPAQIYFDNKSHTSKMLMKDFQVRTW